MAVVRVASRMPQAAPAYSSVEEDRFRAFLAQLLAQPLAAGTVPSSALITPIVLGTDPAPSSSDLLRVGSGVQALAASGYGLSGTYVLWDDGYLRLAHGPVGTDPAFSIGHAGVDNGIYADSDTFTFRTLNSSTARVIIHNTTGEVDVLTGPLVVGTDPGNGPVAPLLRVGGGLITKARSAMLTDGAASAGFWLGADASAQVFVGQNGLTNASNVGVWHGGAWRLEVMSSGEVLIDTGPLVIGTDPGGGQPLRVAGGALMGGNAATGVSLQLNSAAGNIRDLVWLTAGGNRWVMRCNATAESGSNAGSDWQLIARDDTGAIIDTAVQVTRAATGAIALGPSGNRPVIIGADPGTSVLLRVGSGGKFNGTVTATAFSGDGSALTNLTLTGVVKLLYANQNLSTTSTTEVSLASYSLPANSLATAGDTLRITVSGEVTGTAGGTPVIKFGSTTISTAQLYAANSHFTMVFFVAMRTTTTQVSNGVQANTGGTTSVAVGSYYPRFTPLETLTGAVTVDFRGSVVSGGTLVLDSIQVELLKQ